MTRQEILDLDFIDARHKLIDIAAFLDRVDRYEGVDDFRVDAFHLAMSELRKRQPEAAKRVLLSFSDLSEDPIQSATTKAASGAWQKAGSNVTD